MGDICQATGSYQDQNGNNKTRYTKLGAWFKDDQGRISAKLDVLPMPKLRKDNNGEVTQACWVSLFAAQDNNNQGNQNNNRNNQNQNQNRNNNNNGYQNNNNNNNNQGGVPY